MRYKNTQLKLVCCLLGAAALALVFPACQDNAGSQPSSDASKSLVQEIADPEGLQRVLQSSGNRLLMVDFYADWCTPCKQLAPVLEAVARENSERVSVYKVDVEKNRSLAGSYNIRGIPFVAFIQDQNTVFSLMGLHPKDKYVKVIERFARIPETPTGDLVQGTRIIHQRPDAPPDELFVYRGETVKLVVETTDYPYAIHIPEYRIAQEAKPGEDLEITFTADKIGVYPVFCNGKCPTGDGAQISRIVVMAYGATGDTRFTELSAEKARERIAQTNPLILDVRTPGEYYQGHLANARLIPLGQLEDRLSEITAYRDREILLYCRSGNRSTVAAEILARNGFKQLHNLEHGIIEWEDRGFPLEK